MGYELDHMFVAVKPNAPEIATLVAAGFEEGERNRHPGQGTASTGLFFENAYVEFIWLGDSAEAESPAICRTCLAQRTDPEQAVLPFGFGLRSAGRVPENAPFTTWDYRPPYLSADMAIPVASNSENLSAPFLFLMPWKSGPGYECPKHVNGVRRVTKATLTIGSKEKSSAEFAAFSSLGLVVVNVGAAPLLDVELDDGETGNLVDLRPVVPFVIHW